jgi:hypothetical protein
MNQIAKIANDIISSVKSPDTDVAGKVDEMIEAYDKNAQSFMRISPKATGQLCDAIKECVICYDVDAIDIVDSAVDILSIIEQFNR